MFILIHSYLGTARSFHYRNAHYIYSVELTYETRHKVRGGGVWRSKGRGERVERGDIGSERVLQEC